MKSLFRVLRENGRWFWLLIMAVVGVGLFLVGLQAFPTRNDGRKNSKATLPSVPKPAETNIHAPASGDSATSRRSHVIDIGPSPGMSKETIEEFAEQMKRLREEGPKKKTGPTGKDMSGPPLRDISSEIYEWARTKTAEELIALIQENYSPTAEALAQMKSEEDKGCTCKEDEECTTCGEGEELPWENEPSLKASWALAWKLSRDPALYEVMRNFLLSGSLSMDAASRLVEILGLMRDQQAVDLLLYMVKLQNPPASMNSLLCALGGTNQIFNLPPLEEYIAELDYKPPADLGGFPVIGQSRKSLLSAEIMETLLYLLDNRMAQWSAWDQGALFGQFTDLLAAYRELASRNGADSPDMRYVQAILERVEGLARNGPDAAVRQMAVRLYGTYSPNEDAWRPMVDILRSGGDMLLRSTAAGQLRRHGDVPEVENALLDVAKNDPSSIVRKSAIRSLPNIGAAGEAKLALATAWYSPDGHYMTRQEAIALLSTCGPSAIPQLERIANQDVEQELRERALSEIACIRSFEEHKRKMAESQRRKEEAAQRRAEKK